MWLINVHNRNSFEPFFFNLFLLAYPCLVIVGILDVEDKLSSMIYHIHMCGFLNRCMHYFYVVLGNKYETDIYNIEKLKV